MGKVSCGLLRPVQLNLGTKSCDCLSRCQTSENPNSLQNANIVHLLVAFDSTINSQNKNKGRHEPNSAKEDASSVRSEKHITEKKRSLHETEHG